MDSRNTFEILFRKKIPYWSEFLFALMAVFFAFLFLFYLIMIPSDKASGEMKVAYYILVVPEWLKTASTYSFLGLILLIPIYSISKSLSPGLLIIDTDSLNIHDKTKEKTIPVESIRKIILNDIRRTFRKEATEIVIKQGTSRTTSFLLKHYVQTEELVEALSIYNNIEYIFYNEYALETHDDS